MSGLSLLSIKTELLIMLMIIICYHMLCLLFFFLSGGNPRNLPEIEKAGSDVMERVTLFRNVRCRTKFLLSV